jgi:hypothetical protein
MITMADKEKNVTKRIKTIDTKIIAFVKSLSAGHILIPSFQREFVWGEDDIISLWESIYRFYPIGNILCWENRHKAEYPRRPGGAIYYDDAARPRDIYIYWTGSRGHTPCSCQCTRKISWQRSVISLTISFFFDGYNKKFFFAGEYMRRKRETGKDFSCTAS